MCGLVVSQPSRRARSQSSGDAASESPACFSTGGGGKHRAKVRKCVPLVIAHHPYHLGGSAWPPAVVEALQERKGQQGLWAGRSRAYGPGVA